MKVQLAFLADYANVTADGKINVMGMLNIVYAPRVPAEHRQMYLITQYHIEAADRGLTKHLEITFYDPDEIEIFRVTRDAPLPENAPLGATVPQIVELAGLVFEKFGEYRFSISIDGEERVVVPLHVAQSTVEQGG